VERTWLEAMAQSLAPRGPDGTAIWVSGSAGLCHTLFRTTDSDNGPQIVCVDPNLRLVCDARIDDRDALIRKLPRGPANLRRASAAELILHSYAVWGEACVEHLMGDFAFVIWDASRGQIFAARDHLGVKPFYYAHLGPYLLVSNALDAIGRISIVPPELDDYSIGDFLLVGFNKHSARSYFKAIRRLPRAHSLRAGCHGLQTKRYWTLPIEEPIYYRSTRDYPERFLELLSLAVRDRLPAGPLGILMSGGLDSPALAAVSLQLGAAASAFTSVYDRLIPDRERHYAGLVARHLQIPIHYRVKDDEPWGWERDTPPDHTAEPQDNPLPVAADLDYYRVLSRHARVFFFGDGPDAALSYEWQAHLAWLIRERKYRRLCRDIASHLAVHRRIPLVTTLPHLLRERYLSTSYKDTFPSWFNKEFERRVGLRERWEVVREEPMIAHPVHPIAYTSFACDLPMGGVEGFDPATTRIPSQFVHPFWDIRVVRFLLTVPGIPWCRDKYLIRTALRGRIPEPVLMRPKAPLPGLPYLLRIRQFASYPELDRTEDLARYVDMEALPRQPAPSREVIDQQLKILGLNCWLLGRAKRSKGKSLRPPSN
jgi:asparagine synthase (glutamine-hydrolysing)